MTPDPDRLPFALDRPLPPHLEERIDPLNDRPLGPDGRYVLYWMRTAVRGHENPALDTAVALANALGLPAFVYHALDERYPYASDRHHSFILEGARDVQAALADRGIGYAFHLSRPGHRGPHLTTLAKGAAAVVTEDMPTVPMVRWARRLAEAAPVAVLAVDTACVLPMRLVGRAHDRAFAFRKATAKRRDHRLHASWTDIAPDTAAFVPDLPFEPIDLAAASIPDLVAACEIDHGVGPIAHTRGGSVAGYARWTDFRDTRLARYAKRRNDALDRDAVSRMSAYLHYGQVSPLRIAREAAAAGGAGAEKFLDELLVWREMAYVFCKYEPGHEDVSVLPDWARESLAAAEFDRREALYAWEELARGATHEPLWNAAQWSLHRQGELHNNLRMTWGKEIVGWTPDAATALDRLIDLNHRYALDGRDPNSYGGLLWCLGGFDRPFDPPQAVLGRVRPRSAAIHARRLDVDAYTAQVAGPAGTAPAVAVIGAGMAGLACARTLADHGWPVTVFDKGRGPGGRMSTRRADPERGLPDPVDHGAQYFTADDPRFRRFVDSWVEAGVAAPWDGRIVTLTGDGIEQTRPRDRFVGLPGMNGVIRHLATDLDARFGVRVAGLAAEGGGWRLTAEDGGDLGR
ncbi:MAG: FAD-dependent oxidoreductase, partial [Deinococcus-Thermus bacterium]|nr:FAD-dependent oxidoreductase [Deinococcota bacterium]